MAGDQSPTQQAGTVPTIKSQTIIFLHLLGILNGVGMKTIHVSAGQKTYMLSKLRLIRSAAPEV